MALKTLLILAGIAVLVMVFGAVALLTHNATWEQATAFISLALTALYTYIRAEPKQVDPPAGGNDVPQQ